VQRGKKDKKRREQAEQERSRHQVEQEEQERLRSKDIGGLFRRVAKYIDQFSGKK
jgi:hypothetical protein